MKIAFLIHDYNRTWGQSRYVAELATRFCGNHEVHVFANSIESDPLAKGVQFHIVPAWRRNALSTIISFLAPATWQLRERFDIVHAQGLCGFRYNVLTAHQCNREWYRSRKPIETKVPWREHVFGTVVSAMEEALYRAARRTPVIAISERIAKDLRRHYRCAAPIEVIHHGTDLELFHPAHRARYRADVRRAWGVAEEEKVFLFVGDLRKGARQCILALAATAHGKLVCVSRSADQECRMLALRAGVGSRVIFAGPSEQVERAYASADAFLLPTPYDPFALVVTEAMSAGLPVIVSREAGAAELIDSGRNGILLDDVGDAGELAIHMNRLLNEPEFAAGLGVAARLTMEQRSWDDVATKTLAVYEKFLTQAGAHS